MQNARDPVSAALEAHAVPIATRKGQKLLLAPQPREMFYIIRRGIFLARAPVTEGRYQVLGIIYPDDIVRADAMLPLDGTEITCASDGGEVWRLAWPFVKERLDTDRALARLVADRLATQAARATLHGTVMTALTGDERVAALLIELALRTGRRTAAGMVFDMPLSRIDIAEHLALNPDTVSRIVSRMRRAGVLAPAGRNRIVCPSFETLSRSCPLNAAVARMHTMDVAEPAKAV